MKTFSLILGTLFFAAITSGFAQFRSVDTTQINDNDQHTVMRLTPEMFKDKLSLPDFTPEKDLTFQFLETGTSRKLLYLGTDILKNKHGFETFSRTPHPRTVTEYNNTVRRQMFDAEPTSQRRSPILFRFN